MGKAERGSRGRGAVGRENGPEKGWGWREWAPGLLPWLLAKDKTDSAPTQDRAKPGLSWTRGTVGGRMGRSEGQGNTRGISAKGHFLFLHLCQALPGTAPKCRAGV